MIPAPASLVVPFAESGGRNTILIPSQIGVAPNKASFTDGFPPATRLAIPLGGVPPAGLDMNGILYMMSATIAWIQAGGTFAFNSDVVDNWTGYGVGAIIRSAIDPKQFFYNTLADNINDPDGDTTGWIPFNPLSNPTNQQIEVPAAGTFNNVLINEGVGFLDVDTSAGNVIYTGMTAGSDGQIVKVSNVGANLLTLNANDVGSLAANRYRSPAALSFTQYGGQSFRYSIQATRWIPL